jgi:glycerophosphoryl diester phosphodiesterase
VEFDLQPTRDGTPVLFHDHTLDRTTDGTGLLSSHSLADLSGLDAGRWFGAEFAGEAIPTLDAALDLLQGSGIRIFAELKGPADLAFTREVCARITASGLGARCHLISMDWDALAHVRSLPTGLAVGFIAEAEHRLEDALRLAGERSGDLLDPDHRLLAAAPDIAGQAVEQGIPMAVWTVDSPSDAVAMRALGVGALTTNQVERLLDWRDGS